MGWMVGRIEFDSFSSLVCGVVICLSTLQELRLVQGDLQTTAVPRPNAYLPEDIALPRPYGAMAPFKPSEPGSTMRHTVKPQPREIEI